MKRIKRQYGLGVQSVIQRPLPPRGFGGQDAAGVLTGGATGFAAGGPAGAAVGAGLNLFSSLANISQEKTQFNKDLQQFKLDDIASQNRGIFNANEIPQQLNQPAAHGKYATGTGSVEVERDELVFQKTATGKYLLKQDFYGGKTHNQGGENYQATEGDIIFPGKDRKKVIKAYKAQDYPKLEAMRTSLPKDTKIAQDGLDHTDPKKKSALAQQYAFLNDPNFVPPQIPIQQEGIFQEAIRINKESLQEDFGNIQLNPSVKKSPRFQLRELEKALREGKPGVTQELIDKFKASPHSGFTSKKIDRTDPKQNPMGLRGGNIAFGLGFSPDSTTSGFQGNPLTELPTYDVNPDGSTTPIKSLQTFKTAKGRGYIDPRVDPNLGPQSNPRFREHAQTGFGFSTNPLQQFTPRNITSVAGKKSLLYQMKGTQASIAAEGETLKTLQGGPDFGNIAGYVAQAGGALANLFPGEAEVQTTPKVKIDRLRHVDTSERLRQGSKVQERVEASNARNVSGGNVQNYLANRKQAGISNFRRQQNINAIEFERANRVANQNAILSGREEFFNSQLGVRDIEANAANRAAQRQSRITGIGQLGQLGGLIGRDRRGQRNEDELRKVLGNATLFDLLANFKTT